MRVARAAALIVLTAGFAHSAVCEEAYLMVEAVRVPASERQPTWIGLSRGNRILHVPTATAVNELEPGRYAVVHVDFAESSASGVGTLNLREHVPFKLDPGTITVFGRIEISESDERVWMRIDRPTTLLAKLCATHGDVLERSLVRVLRESDKPKDVRVRCEPAEPAPWSSRQ